MKIYAFKFQSNNKPHNMAITETTMPEALSAFAAWLANSEHANAEKIVLTVTNLSPLPREDDE